MIPDFFRLFVRLETQFTNLPCVLAFAAHPLIWSDMVEPFPRSSSCTLVLHPPMVIFANMASNAPMSHLPPAGCGLLTPLWSVVMVVPHPFVSSGIASIAGLMPVHPEGVPDAVHRAMVCVGPPLFASVVLRILASGTTGTISAVGPEVVGVKPTAPGLLSCPKRLKLLAVMVPERL